MVERDTVNILMSVRFTLEAVNKRDVFSSHL